MTNQERFNLVIAKDSNDTRGWNGWVQDKLTAKMYPLVKTVAVDRKIGYATGAFDTRAELRAAAKRKARTLARAAA